VPHAIRPGDVLAGRYELVDLLDESAGGLFWRAYDASLDRSVAVHIIRADDERAGLLREAARTSARVVDRRLLRVLDVDQTTDQTARDGSALCYVVNEWATGVSLDILLADGGPLAPRRAAWLIGEVATTIEVAHAAGVAHGRLVPENVLIDRTGSVRVIGFAVDAALHGLPPGGVAADVTALAALLYSGLTARWPGTTPSVVKTAPRTHGRVLRPRQVRAGVPRVLDTLCDAVLNPNAAAPGSHARGNVDLTTAGGISDALREYVGDPAGLADAESAAVRRREAGQATGELGGLQTRTMSMLGLAGPPDTADDPQTEALPVVPPVAESEDDAANPGPEAVHVAREDQPTQAGIPIFGDDGDVAWLAKRAEKPPPPPPFEDLPERPLFAPEPRDGTPARRPRTPVAHGAGAYWPWDTSTGQGSRVGTGSGIIPAVEEEQAEAGDPPGRSWLRLAALVALLTLVLLAVVFAFNLGRGRTPLGAEPQADRTNSPTATSSAGAKLAAFTGVTANDFDPQGDPPEENPDLAPLAVDGNPDTAWRTMTYTQQLGPGGLKTGVGLTLDLGSPGEVGRLDLTLGGSPTGIAVYVTDQAPNGVRDLTPVATTTADGAHAEIALDQPVTGRYVTVWLTSLPQIEGGFRGEVAEVSVLGTRAGSNGSSG
jgi:hypothetical protein